MISPSQWHCLNVESHRFIYGIRCDVAAKNYSIYCTDFSQVWTESKSDEDIRQAAQSQGIDMDDDAMVVLLQSLKSISSEFLTVLLENELRITFSKDLEWTFDLKLASDPEKSQVLAMLNTHQFANHHYLLYKMSVLEKCIAAKERYIVFLEENLKPLAGDDVVKKYHKNNRHSEVYLEKYDRGVWDARVGKLYERRDIWECISQVIDNDSWEQTAGGNSVKRDTDEPDGPVKKELNPFEEEESTNAAKKDPIKEDITNESFKSPVIPPVKLEPESVSPAKGESGLPSPKRNRIGRLPKRRKLN